MPGKLADAEKKIDSYTAATTRVGKAHPGFFVGEAGAVSSDKAHQQGVQRRSSRRPASARSRSR